MRVLTIILYIWIYVDGFLPSANCSSADVADDLLNPARYDKRVRPGAGSGKPVVVKLDMYINSISSIDEVNMQYTVSVFLRQRWRDERLNFSDPQEEITLNYNMYDQLWVPDIFVTNEKSALFHTITVPNRLLRLDPDGNVHFSQRLSLTLECPLNLKYYPMDNQTCKISIESYGYKTDEILLEWKSDSPIQVNEKLKMPEFVLTGSDSGDCTAGYVTGSFSCLYVELKLQRQFAYYLIQTFVPSALIVALSWVSYWIDIHAVPARISLSLLTVLTMTTQSSGISARLPRVSYIKAIDIWMTTCLVFVFGGLIEYSIVNVLARKEHEGDNKKEEKEEEKSMQEADNSDIFVDEPVNGHRVTLNINSVSLQTENTETTQNLKNDKMRTNEFPMNHMDRETDKTNTAVSSKKIKKPGIFLRMKQNPALGIDMVSRILFPLAFLIFNIVYWSVFEVHGLGNDESIPNSQE